jgi:RimJ/RimL family protein N-acetyltransferase
MIIETERLIIRPYTLGDAEDAYRVNLDPDVSRYTGDGGVKSREEMYNLLENTTLADYKKYGYGRMAVIYKPDNQYIGFCGLKFLPDMNTVDIGYRFAKKYWGMGIATESARPFIQYGFEMLQLKEIIGLVVPENVASSNVLKKLDFQFRQLLDYEEERVEEYVITHSKFLQINLNK